MLSRLNNAADNRTLLEIPFISKAHHTILTRNDVLDVEHRPNVRSSPWLTLKKL